MRKVNAARLTWWSLAAGLLCCPVLQADAPAGRYKIIGQTVHDVITTLHWQQQPAPARDWASAQTYCAQLQLEGGGWRLPGVKELLSLADPSRFGPALDPTAFPNNSSIGWSWTASKYARMPAELWVVRTSDGAARHALPDDLNLVRCVR